NYKLLRIRKVNQIKLMSRKVKKKTKLKINIISKIKKRSMRNNIVNEISNDVEKVRLGPENLILLDYIDKKITQS
ncbi:MAG: hypothetical protein ACFFE5_14355, partial [Candidatus Thorarchaeota archaeon]